MSSGVVSLPFPAALPDSVLLQPAVGCVDTRLHVLVDGLISAVGGAALIVDSTGRLIGHGYDGDPPLPAFTEAVLSKRLEPLQRHLRRPRTLSGSAPNSGSSSPRLTSYDVLDDLTRSGPDDGTGPLAALEARIGSGGSALGAVWLLAPAGRCAQEQVRSVLRATAVFAGSAIVAAQLTTEPDPVDQEARLLLNGGGAHPTAAASGWQVTVAALDLPAVPRPELSMALHALLGALRVQAVTPAEQLQPVLEGNRIYLLLHDPHHGQTRHQNVPAEHVRTVVEQLVADATRRLGTQVQAGVGPAAADPADVPASRQVADEILDLPIGPSPCRHVDDLRASLFLARLRRLASGVQFPVRDPLTALTDWDRRRDTEYTRSLRVYLENFGDAAAAAEQLGVHVNTMRYRVKRAMTIAGMDITDPQQRLALHLRLTSAPEATERSDT